MTDPVSNLRKRLVNFRVTDEEYRELRQACLACGSRGISEFARRSILEHARSQDMPASPVTESQTAEYLSAADKHLASFEASLCRLVEVLEVLADRFPKPEPAGDLPPNKG
jgi:uncharacterized protein (DUF1778 family)